MAHEEPAYVREREVFAEQKTASAIVRVGPYELVVKPTLGTLMVHVRGPCGPATRVLYRDDAADLTDAMGAMLDGE